MPDTVQMRALQRAAEILGGVDALRTYLNVSNIKLEAWLKGRATPPDAIFLRIVDLLSAESQKLPQSGDSP